MDFYRFILPIASTDEFKLNKNKSLLKFYEGTLTTASVVELNLNKKN
jgi:hypothetical protein